MRSSRGFTIIEVSISLAVAGALLISAIGIFRGSQGKSQFDQAMRDVSAKLEQTADEVRNNDYPDTSRYTCSIDSTGHATLSPGSNTIGNNPYCLFLGKALQVTPGSSTINIIGILGNQTIPLNSVNDLYGANPISAPQLNQSYTLIGGTKVTSATQSAIAAPVAGFFSSPSGSQPGRAGGLPLLAKVGKDVDCVDSSTCAADLTEWDICFAGGGQTAMLKLTPSPQGVSIQVEDKKC